MIAIACTIGGSDKCKAGNPWFTRLVPLKQLSGQVWYQCL